jgi:error-prone DNA polymerase
MSDKVIAMPTGGEDAAHRVAIVRPVPPFAELVTATHFSFLRGASNPADLILRAVDLGLAGIGIADRNSVAGVVRAWSAMKAARKAQAEAGDTRPLPRFVVGARLVFVDGTPDIITYPADRAAWGRLTRLLTTGNLRAEKGNCILRLADLLAFHEGLQLIVLPESTATPQLPRRSPVAHDSAAPVPPLALVQPEGLAALLARLARIAPGRVWLGAAMNRRGRDARRLARLTTIAADAGVPVLATNDVLYATPDERQLHDVLTCIRDGVTVAAAGTRLQVNAERHLKPPDEMARLFRDSSHALAETIRFLDGIGFDLEQLKYEYPHEPVPDGWEPQVWLEHIVLAAARERYGPDLTPDVRADPVPGARQCGQFDRLLPSGRHFGRSIRA